MFSNPTATKPGASYHHLSPYFQYLLNDLPTSPFGSLWSIPQSVMIRKPKSIMSLIWSAPHSGFLWNSEEKTKSFKDYKTTCDVTPLLLNLIFPPHSLLQPCCFPRGALRYQVQPTSGSLHSVPLPMMLYLQTSMWISGLPPSLYSVSAQRSPCQSGPCWSCFTKEFPYCYSVWLPYFVFPLNNVYNHLTEF